MFPEAEKKVYKGKIPFGNGKVHSTDRYFIVAKIDEHKCYLLNCSSIRKKKRKLMFASNTELEQCIPPLKEKTMVKMDEIYQVEVDCLNILQPLPSTLTDSTYKKFMKDFKSYIERKHVVDPTIFEYSYGDIVTCN